MVRKILLGGALLGASVAGLALLPRSASACGGFFCSQVPVIQTGEQIIFAIDDEKDTVDVLINISYQGPAEDFSWVLPLTDAPQDLRIGSNWAFVQVNRITTPQFQFSEIIEEGVCGSSGGFGGRGGDANQASEPSAPPAPDEGGVQVLLRKAVGPYDSVVIRSPDPEEIRSWLT